MNNTPFPRWEPAGQTRRRPWRVRRLLLLLLAPLLLALGLVLPGVASAAVPVGDFTLIKGGTPSTGSEVWAQLWREATVKVTGTDVSASYLITGHDAEYDVDFPMNIEMTGTYERSAGKISGLYSISSDKEYDYYDLELFPKRSHRRVINVETGAFSGEVKGDQFDSYCELSFEGQLIITDTRDGEVMPGSTYPIKFSVTFIIKASDWTSNHLEISRLAPNADVRVSHDGGGTWEPAAQFSVLRAGDQMKVAAAPDTNEIVVLNDHNYRLVILESETTIELDEHGWFLQKGKFYLKDLPGRDPAPEPPTPPAIIYTDSSHMFDLDVLGWDLDPPGPGRDLQAQAAASTQPAEFECDLSDTGPSTISVYSGEVTVKSQASRFPETVLRAGERAVSTTDSIEITPAPPSFADVSATNPYAAAITGLEMAGTVSGKRQGSTLVFGPSDPVLRMQFAKMIVKGLGLATSEADTCPFGDVPANLDQSDSLYPDNYVAVCARNHITEGKTSTTFAPYDNITRAQLMTMLVRAARNLAPGSLVEPPDYYQPTVAEFEPKEHYDNYRTAEYNRLLLGLVGFGPSWDPFANATHGEVAQLLWELLSQKVAGGQSPEPTPQLLFSDDFSNPASGWLTGGDDNLQLQYDPVADRFTMTYPRPNSATSFRPALYGEFSVEADALCSSSGKRATYGLAARAATPYVEEYAFLVSNEGYWEFDQVSGGIWSFVTPVQQNHSPAIKTGTAWNHIKVVADGSKIDGYINGTRVLEFNDAVLSSGEIGLVSLTQDSGVQIGFDNFKVWPPE